MFLSIAIVIVLNWFPKHHSGSCVKTVFPAVSAIIIMPNKLELRQTTTVFAILTLSVIILQQMSELNLALKFCLVVFKALNLVTYKWLWFLSIILIIQLLQFVYQFDYFFTAFCDAMTDKLFAGSAFSYIHIPRWPWRRPIGGRTFVSWSSRSCIGWKCKQVLHFYFWY